MMDIIKEANIVNTIKKGLTGLSCHARAFIADESGAESTEMAILLPIVLLLVAFIVDRFLWYEGQSTVVIAANEALRAAIIQESPSEARAVARQYLEDRFSRDAGKMGICSGNEVGCTAWKGKNSQFFKLTVVDNNGRPVSNERNAWDSRKKTHVQLYVRAHKASLLPSFKRFRTAFADARSRRTIYHDHTYTIKARVEWIDDSKDI